MVKTYGELYRQLRHILRDEEGSQAPQTARELMSFVTGYAPAALMGMDVIYASEETTRRCLELAGRILAGEPLAYILGQWSFYGLPLTVTPDVLIPRDDTMAVVELALGCPLPAAPRILDLCTGSGCIGLALASRLREARVTLVDVSPRALRIAKKNTTDLKLTARVSCIQGDVREPASRFLGQFDLIISNPPYVTGAEMETLPRSVRDYEPHLALFGGEDGLDFYRAIAQNAIAALKKGGLLCFEFGDDQGDDVCRILDENGYTILERTRDYHDRERAVLARYGRKEV